MHDLTVLIVVFTALNNGGDFTVRKEYLTHADCATALERVLRMDRGEWGISAECKPTGRRWR